MIGRPIDIDLDLEPRERKTTTSTSTSVVHHSSSDSQGKIKLKKIELVEREDAIAVPINSAPDDGKKKKTCISKLKAWAKSLKRTLGILIFALRHPECPFIAKLIGWFTVIYALSPIDLIPDCIPILGYLDDLIIVPIGIYLTCKFIPKRIWEEAEKKFKEEERSKPPKDWRGAVLVVFIWLITGYWIIKSLFL
jgi:uncharacterized membrane protein YkvA (DUF1232 family)